jgi:hypothetical protein
MALVLPVSYDYTMSQFPEGLEWSHPYIASVFVALLFSSNSANRSKVVQLQKRLREFNIADLLDSNTALREETAKSQSQLDVAMAEIQSHELRRLQAIVEIADLNSKLNFWFYFAMILIIVLVGVCYIG